MASSSVTYSFLLFTLLAIVPLSFQTCHKGKFIHIPLYLHRIIEGPEATTLTIINPGKIPYSFGTTRVNDHELRVGKDPKSKLVARLQGVSVESSLAKTRDILLLGNVVFVAGKYNNSIVSIYGRRSVPSYGKSVISIIAGTEKFLMAKGYIVRGMSYNCSSKATVSSFDIYIKPYCKKHLELEPEMEHGTTM
ncbi:uncharacterized protein A4U43_C10F12430 [Asparagus officinalis]|uniref:Dirigent protein n=1 Tax=Asparagus officinalis TaxID=4686 RepID=A0A5P1E443_ASPOF|nr:dirigent protein 4-like [Asparagus officinalis]ONK56753.1 uncharacterized protein A4U43_C10F12430 [Asparagus officinalis]